MAAQRFVLLDPAAGISGDMLLGALVAAGASPDWLRGVPARLGFPDVVVDIHDVDRCGVRAVKVDVRLPDGRSETPADTGAGEAHGAHDHAHHHHHDHHHHQHDHPHHGHHHHGDGGTHGHHHDHGHRRVGELIAIVEAAPLSAWVRERAVAAFRLLGEAEGAVHGMPAEDVLLHEVGAVDAVVDIVAGIEGFEQLGVTRVHAWPVAVGNGWVRAAHGVLSVPTPATSRLLEGVPVRDAGPVTGEATTPTGAVLLRVLSAGPPPEGWRLLQGGAWGAGGRNPGHYANALRLMVAEAAPESGEVEVVATDLDDLAPEYLEPLRDALTGAGALDVQVWATQAKKGRTGFRVEALVSPGRAQGVVDALLRHSPTGGLRRWRAARTTLPRREMTLEPEPGIFIRVKVLDAPDGPRVKPEFDDVARLAQRWGRPAFDVARELQTEALRLLGANGDASAQARNVESMT